MNTRRGVIGAFAAAFAAVPALAGTALAKPPIKGDPCCPPRYTLVSSGPPGNAEHICVCSAKRAKKCRRGRTTKARVCPRD